jgi:tetratricopeptide (TPR) repeat protein
MKRLLVAFALLLPTLMLSGGCRHNIDLTRPSSQVDFGVEAARMNLWREALFRFQRAVDLNPSDAMARNNLAVAYESIGDYEKARTAYVEALRLDKSNEYIQKNYSRFTEFVSKNRKRERRATGPVGKSDSTAATPAGAQPAASPPSAPAPGTATLPSNGAPGGPAPQAPPAAAPPAGTAPAATPAPPSPPPTKPLASPGGLPR